MLGPAIDLARHMARQRLLLTAALSLAYSLTTCILDLAVARLGALAFGPSDARVITDLRDVESRVAL
jgi:hypothetical protein